MSENQEEASAPARQEIEKLRLENGKLREERDELIDLQLSYTGLPGHMHRLDVKIKELKSLLIRAADALENGPSETHFQLVQELRKAAE
jgi:hypothetical protein